MRNGLVFFTLFFVILATLASITLGCGSSKPVQNTTAQLQSISLSPAQADAKDFANGEVPFIATGYYSAPPSPITPLDVWSWGACAESAPTTDVTISNAGVAQCAEGASGTYQIFGADGTTCLAITACGGGCQIAGYARLTCP